MAVTPFLRIEQHPAVNIDTAPMEMIVGREPDGETWYAFFWVRTADGMYLSPAPSTGATYHDAMDSALSDILRLLNEAV